MDKTSQARDKAISKLVERAQKDEQFRNLLLNDPKKAVESETGKPVPSGVQIHVMEQSRNHVYVVLPEPSQGELTDEDLEAASGGVSDVVSMY